MKFEKIYIEISDICGLKCRFCPSKKGVRGAMSVEDFAKIAAKVAKFGRIFTFHVLGDPLKMPNLAEFIDIAKTHEMPLELTTSGFFMSEKITQILLENKNIRQVNFSLMANLSQRRVSFDEYFAPILCFIKMHQSTENPSFVNLRLWNLRPNFEPPKENEVVYERLEREFSVKIARKEPKNRLSRHIFLNQMPLFRWTSQKIHTKGRCHGLSKQIAILSSGVVVPCCMDVRGDIALGDIFTQNLSEILNSPRAKNMRQGFAQNKLTENLCKSCEFGSLKTHQI